MKWADRAGRSLQFDAHVGLTQRFWHESTMIYVGLIAINGKLQSNSLVPNEIFLDQVYQNLKDR